MHSLPALGVSRLPGTCTALLAAWLALAAPARAAVDLASLDQTVRAELLAQSDGAAPGSDVLVGLHLRHAPHWHTYWVEPGDAGLPTRLRWSLPPGYEAGPIQWPLPRRLRVGNLANYGYEGEVLLPVNLHVPAGAVVGSTAHVAAHADWLVCSDLCIPGGADLALDLPVRSPAQVHPGADAALFAAAQARVPGAARLAEAHARRDGTHLHLEFVSAGKVPHMLEFFPLDAGRIAAAADQAMSTRAQAVRLDLQAATPIEADFTRLRGVLVADGGPAPGGTGWAGTVDLPLQPVAGAAGAHEGAATPAGPGDAGVASGTPAGISGNGVSANPASADASAAVRPPSVPADAPASAGTGGGAGMLGTLVALAGAFVGGLILNLMPCVFPVLSLKLIGLVQHQGTSAARMRAHGLAFTGGVVLSFLALAALLLALRAAGAQIGWGFQLQSPLVIAALLALFFLIGLNLLGCFEFTLGAGLANSRAARALDGDGLRGSFATGVLAAVVAAPCTAPFMGAALGYAVTQPAPLALLVFATLGAGMAAPYLVLTLVPAWLRRLPRPGAWMERLRQFMAFPMFLTCVWLFWVLGQQVDVDALAASLAALVALALCAWSLGLVQRGARRFAWLAGGAALALVLLAVPLARVVLRDPIPAAAAAAPAGNPSPVAWSAWSPAAQRAALDRKQPVFVDFTAAWCITCQANKRLVLHDERVERAFAQAGVVRLQADWTRRDEAITRELARFARSGVPLYVLYDRNGTPHLLPEILSADGVLAALGAV